MARLFLDMAPIEGGRVMFYARNTVGDPILGPFYLDADPSTVAQEGDQWGALAANRVCILDDANMVDGRPMPLLNVDGGFLADLEDTGWIRQLRQDTGSSTIPTELLYGQLYITQDGHLYTGDSDDRPVSHLTEADVTSITNGINAALTALQNTVATQGTTLSNHISAANPHSGSASTAALNNHINATGNVHSLTLAQLGALGNSGNQTLNGNFTANGNLTGQMLQITRSTPQIRLTNAAGYDAFLQWGDGTNSNFVFAMAGSGANTGRFIFTTSTDLGAYRSILAASYDDPSSAEYKKNIRDIAKTRKEAFKKLRVTDFTYKATGEKRVGVIAEEVAKLDATFLGSDGDANSVSLNNIAYTNVAVTQEHEARINALEATVKTLETTVKALEAKLK